MAEILPFTGITSLDMPAEYVLEAAKKAGLSGVVIIGETEDGGEYFASSIASGPEALWLMERFKTQLLAIPDRDDGK